MDGGGEVVLSDRKANFTSDLLVGASRMMVCDLDIHWVKKNCDHPWAKLQSWFVVHDLL